ncbi:MAG: collagen-like protein, partial [Methanobrevibacter sp.]|nr:collagen-like protein [Methanobrevibacter sp.]
MLKFGNKEFRNLQEQVYKNMNDILFILQEEGVLNEFGIKVVGQEATAADMPSVADYKEDNPDWAYGDAYAIGTEDPYELYILTRANGTHPNDYWFNIGQFPVPGPEGPQGPQGETGPQGQTGPSGANGYTPDISISTFASTLSAGESAYATIVESGTASQPHYDISFGIPRGADGSTLTSVAWGSIYGSIADQTDLVNLVQGRVKKVTTTGSRRVYGIDDSGNQAVYTLGSDILTPVELSGYAQLSVANIYTEEQHMTKGIAFESSSVDFIKNDGENFYDYVLPYASGTIALSENFDGSYSGSYWTSIKINGTTKQIPQGGGGGGGNAEWGSISGTLSDQLDLMSKFSEYAKIEDIPSLSGYATESWVSSNFLSEVPSEYATQSWVQSQNYITSSALSGYATEVYVQNSLSDYAKTSDLSIYALESELSLYATVSALSSYATVDSLSVYATISGLDSAISGVNSTIASLDYLSVGALSSETVIPDITGLASEGFVNDSISALSSIYAPLSDYASTSYVNNAIDGLSSIYASISYVDALSSVYASKSELPNMSLYAELSASNEFTQVNTFPGINISGAGSIYNDYGALRLENGDAKIGMSTTMLYGLNTTGTIKFAASDGIKLAQGNLLSNGVLVPNGSEWDGDRLIATVNDIPDLTGYATESWVLSQSYASAADLNGYALLSSNNTFTNSNTFYGALTLASGNAPTIQGYSGNSIGGTWMGGNLNITARGSNTNMSYVFESGAFHPTQNNYHPDLGVSGNSQFAWNNIALIGNIYGSDTTQLKFGSNGSIYGSAGINMTTPSGAYGI